MKKFIRFGLIFSLLFLLATFNSCKVGIDTSEEPLPPQGQEPLPPEGQEPLPPEGQEPLPPEGQEPLPPEGQEPLPPEGQEPLPPEGQEPLPPEGQEPLPPEGEIIEYTVSPSSIKTALYPLKPVRPPVFKVIEVMGSDGKFLDPKTDFYLEISEHDTTVVKIQIRNNNEVTFARIFSDTWRSSEHLTINVLVDGKIIATIPVEVSFANLIG